MKSSSHLYILVLALLLPVLLPGCIREDLPACPSGLKVFATYVDRNVETRTGIDPQEVNRFDLFLFDAQGILRGIWVDEEVTLTHDYFMSIPNQPTGDYRLVLWDGIYECYTTDPSEMMIGKTTFDEAYLLLNHQPDEVIAGVPPLFHGIKVEHLRLEAEQSVYIPLYQNHNRVNLTTEGLLSNGDTYSLSIHDNNGKYKFDDSFAETSAFTYAVTCDKDPAGQLLASLNILRLARDRNPVIEVTNDTKGTMLYRENLVELLNYLGEIDYDSDHIFDIHLIFGLDVSVVINGWQVVDNGKFILR